MERFWTCLECLVYFWRPVRYARRRRDRRTAGPNQSARNAKGQGQHATGKPEISPAPAQPTACNGNNAKPSTEPSTHIAHSISITPALASQKYCTVRADLHAVYGAPLQHGRTCTLRTGTLLGLTVVKSARPCERQCKSLRCLDDFKGERSFDLSITIKNASACEKVPPRRSRRGEKKKL